MRRGQMGISLSFIAIVAFIAVIFDWTIPLFLVIGYAFAFEKDTWLSQQVTQAGILYVAYKLAVLIFRDWIFGSIGLLFRMANAPSAYAAMLSTGSVFATIFNIGMLVLSVWAILRLLKDKDAGVPLAVNCAKKFVPGATLDD